MKKSVAKAFNEVRAKHPYLVKNLLDKSSREQEGEQQTIYGDLLDWVRDMYCTTLDATEREELVKQLIADYVIRNPYCLQRVYLVMQESDVDGEILFNAVPCTSMETAKAVLAQEKHTILHESHHFANLTEDDMEEMEVEESEESFFINDPSDDYYEDIRIEAKNIMVK